MTGPTASQAIDTLLERFRQKSRVQARALITSVFGDAVLPRGGRVWLGSLIQLLAPLDINERLVRTTVFRLVKEEWLQAEAQIVVDHERDVAVVAVVSVIPAVWDGPSAVIGNAQAEKAQKNEKAQEAQS